MDTHFDISLKKLLGIEGDYVDDPSDSGGKTRYGITEAVARERGYSGDMSALPIDLAREIYKVDYWDRSSCDPIAAVFLPLAEQVFDLAVNGGRKRAGRYLQRALNSANRGEADYPDVTVDGAIGRQSIAALEAYANHRGREGLLVLLTIFASLQGSHYVRLSEKRPKDERYVYGWFSQRITRPAINLARTLLA